MKSVSHLAKHLTLILTIALVSLPGISTCQELVLDLKKVGSLVEDWTDAHNKKNVWAFKRMYADEVIFYAKTFPKASCLDAKSKRLASNTYFQLKVITQRPIITVYSTGIIKVAFIKKVTSGSVSTNYDSYLLLKQADDNLLIMGESDLIADSTANFSPNLGTELKRSLLPNALLTSNKEERPTTDAIIPDDGSVITPDSIEPDDRSAIAIISVGIISVIIGGYAMYRIQRPTPSEPENDILSVAKNATPYLKPKPSTMTAPDRARGNIPQVQTQEPPYKEHGDAFERFIVARFSNKGFTLLDWRGDKVSNGIYPKSNTYPDLEIEFRFADLKKIFAVECKYRRNLNHGVFKLDKRQYDNYMDFSKSKNIPVYVALGVGDDPNHPTDLFIIPLNAFDNDGSLVYNKICNYYDNPKYKFYYDPKTQDLRHYRKF